MPVFHYVDAAPPLQLRMQVRHVLEIEIALEGRLLTVLINRGALLRRGDHIDERMFRRQDHIGRTEERVGAGREDLDAAGKRRSIHDDEALARMKRNRAPLAVMVLASNRLTGVASEYTARAVVNATGALSTTWQDPYGATRGTPPTAWTGERGFVGGTKDATGLTRIGARDYDPALQRFSTVDPVQDLADQMLAQARIPLRFETDPALRALRPFDATRAIARRPGLTS